MVVSVLGVILVRNSGSQSGLDSKSSSKNKVPVFSEL